MCIRITDRTAVNTEVPDFSSHFALPDSQVELSLIKPHQVVFTKRSGMADLEP